MPIKEEREIPLFDASSGKRAYGKIPWAEYANGETWRFDKATDWPDVKTAGQVVDMAKRFAAREGYVLKHRSEGESVWVNFTKVQEESAEGNPFEGENAEQV